MSDRISPKSIRGDSVKPFRTSQKLSPEHFRGVAPKRESTSIEWDPGSGSVRHSCGNWDPPIQFAVPIGCDERNGRIPHR